MDITNVNLTSTPTGLKLIRMIEDKWNPQLDWDIMETFHLNHLFYLITKSGKMTYSHLLELSFMFRHLATEVEDELSDTGMCIEFLPEEALDDIAEMYPSELPQW